MNNRNHKNVPPVCRHHFNNRHSIFGTRRSFVHEPLNYKNLDEYEEEYQQQTKQLKQEKQQLHQTRATYLPQSSLREREDIGGDLPEELLTVSKTFGNSEEALLEPIAIDLPKYFFIKTIKARDEKAKELLLSVEMFIGRIAIIMAVCILVEETFIGSSLFNI